MDVSKRIIEYKRSDGIDLSATLYLPKGYDINKKQKLPMIMWAYPREFKDNKSASQITQNKNEFTFPYWGSPIYWLTRGYVVLDDVSFPIIGEGDNQPNDNFRKQLVDNASSAINKVFELGYIDKEKVAAEVIVMELSWLQIFYPILNFLLLELQGAALITEH